MALNLIWSPSAPPSRCSLARRRAFGDRVSEVSSKPQLSKKSEDDACLETTSQDVSPRDFPTRDLGPRRFGNHTWGCPIKAVLHLHLGLARLWQQHIEDWTNGRWRAPSEPSRDADPVGSAQPSDPIAPRPSVVATANGHELLYHADCVFCVKCGRQTKYHKHVRLKITSKQCTQKNLQRDRWLSEPGLHRATSRLADELAKLRDVYNRGLHTLHWNRQIGKDPAKVEQYGMLWCFVCGASWAWRYKANNLPRSVCRIPKNRPVPPAWWHSLPISEQVAVASPESETIEPVVILPEQPPLQHPSSIGAVHRDVPPRRRIRCKMPIRETTPQQRQSHRESLFFHAEHLFPLSPCSCPATCRY